MHLNTSTFQEAKLPIDWLSPTVKEYIRSVAGAYGCPQDYVVALCLITAGVAAGKKVVLETSPYINYPTDFCCLVGKQSRNKTSPLKEITSPLRKYDEKNHSCYIKSKAIYYHKKQQDKNFNEEFPVFHQRVIDDSSSEARNLLLSQGDMIISPVDELKTFIDTLGRYAKGGNGSSAEISQLLSIWSNMSFSINRISDDPKLVCDPAMSIVGGIQPGLLQKTFGLEAMMDSGFNARFIFVYADKVEFIPRRNRIQMTQEVRDKWESIIGNFLKMSPLTLQLSNDAKNMYYNYADSNDMNADKEEDDYVGGVTQKMNIHVLRLAIMAHLLSAHWNEPVITAEGMEHAIRMADYLTRIHIERIYPMLRGSAAVQRPMTNGDLIRAVNRQFKIKSQNSLADAIGVSQQYINHVLKE